MFRSPRCTFLARFVTNRTKSPRLCCHIASIMPSNAVHWSLNGWDMTSLHLKYLRVIDALSQIRGCLRLRSNINNFSQVTTRCPIVTYCLSNYPVMQTQKPWFRLNCVLHRTFRGRLWPRWSSMRHMDYRLDQDDLWPSLCDELLWAFYWWHWLFHWLVSTLKNVNKNNTHLIPRIRLASMRSILAAKPPL